MIFCYIYFEKKNVEKSWSWINKYLKFLLNYFTWKSRATTLSLKMLRNSKVLLMKLV